MRYPTSANPPSMYNYMIPTFSQHFTWLSMLRNLRYFTIRVLLLTLGYSLSYEASAIQIQAPTKLPNIVYIMADDMGWRDLGVTGSQYYETPAIDKLAQEGLRFENAYASAPVCAPTRAALMTGKSPAQLHLTAVFDRDRGKMPLLPPNWKNELPLEEVTIADRLKAVGYRTAIMGKWHLGLTEVMWPKARGFDVNVAAWASGRPDSYFAPYNNPKLKDGPDGEYLTRRIAGEAVDFIKENRDSTFFLYLPFYSPHAPLEAPEETIARFQDKEPDGKQANPAYAAMIHELDKAVGAVVKTLEDEGLSDNTIVVFTSDNGGILTLWDLKITDNAPLRAEKFLLYEGGIRVPMIVKWPGHTPAGEVTSQLAISHDMVPTLMSMIGHPVLGNQLEGRDLTPVLKNGERATFPRMLTWHYPHYMPRQDMRPSSAIRIGDYKLIHWHESHRIELYNLSDDIGEVNNLSASQPEVAAGLYEQLDNWRKEIGAQMPVPNPTFTPKHAEE